MVFGRVALQFIHEMQSKALKSWDASKSQALPVFSVGVAFIDESMLSFNTTHEVDQSIEEIRMTVLHLDPPQKKLHITPIESIYSLDFMEGRNKLKELLLNISDSTGKEDFLQHLRMCSLQKVLNFPLLIQFISLLDEWVRNNASHIFVI